ncbi:MAG: hypothetical protein M1832_000480 [Thelocarpon impressellum]|nr:MAG: hypothetical protein M1832_000480 [Thelocarpon impressellum]
MVAGTSLVTLAILLAGATSALAQYTTDPSPSPAAPSQGSTAGGAPSAACYRDERPSVNQSFTASANQSYTVELNSWAQPDGTCNDSVLAKLGDQCGTINDWKCDRADGSTDRLTFTTGSGARLGCVEDALSLASIGNGAPFQVKLFRSRVTGALCLR